MALWVDKHRPHKLADLDYHNDQNRQLSVLVSSDDFPHLLVFGPSGAGKRTRVQCILRELYGAGVERQRIERKQFLAPSGKKLEIVSVASNYHIEINPSEVGIYDRVVVQEVIKTIAQTAQLDVSTQKEFKVVILSEADQLTRDAQHALRRTMEQYMSQCRLILVTKSISKIISPLRSRCLAVRVSAPGNSMVARILRDVHEKELQCRADPAAEKLFGEVARKAEGNLRKALLMLETANVQILKVRERFYELLTRCIPPTMIFQRLVRELATASDASIRPQLVSLAAEYEHRMHMGSKPIYHLEAFVAQFMAVYKQFLEDVAMML